MKRKPLIFEFEETQQSDLKPTDAWPQDRLYISQQIKPKTLKHPTQSFFPYDGVPLLPYQLSLQQFS